VSVEKTSKDKFKEKAKYAGPFTAEEDSFLSYIDEHPEPYTTDDLIDCLVRLREKERELAPQGNVGLAAYTPVVPYAVGPKAY
jgi:hypothetical protein